MSTTSVQTQSGPKSGFSSRAAYLFTAVGSAVGFGNVWRFPYLVYQHGGIAFIILYLFVVALITYPIMILEMGVGQIARGGQVQAWSKLGRRSRSPALAGWVSFNVCMFYPLLLAWSLIFFVNSFQTFGWSNPPEWENLCKGIETSQQCQQFATSSCKWQDNVCQSDVLYNSNVFFRESVYAYYDFEGRDADISITGINGFTVLFLFITWGFSVICVFAGAKIMGYAQYPIMSLPTIFLVLLVIVGATLEGAGDGVVSYIGRFNAEKFSKITFVDVVCQSVFSASLGQGVMASLASHNAPTDNFVINGLVVLVTDTLFAFIAGFAVFSMIGFLAHQAKVPIAELPLKGILLAFSTYPAALSQIGGIASNVLAAVFFITLWLIGFSTILTLVETIVLSLIVSSIGQKLKLKRWVATTGVASFFFLLPGLLTSTTLGFAFLDSLDNYSSLSQGFVAGMQAYVIGWFYLAEYSIEKVGSLAYIVHAATFIAGPILLGILDSINIAAAVVLGLGIPIIGLGVSIVLCNKADPRPVSQIYTPYTLRNKLYYLSVYNVQPLRKTFNEAACQNSRWRVPLVWIFAIKYFVPFVVAYLTMTALTDPSKMYKYPSPDYQYPWYVFLLGQLGPFLLMISFIVFTIFPESFAFILPPQAAMGREIIGENYIHEFDLGASTENTTFSLEGGVALDELNK